MNTSKVSVLNKKCLRKRRTSGRCGWVERLLTQTQSIQFCGTLAEDLRYLGDVLVRALSNNFECLWTLGQVINSLRKANFWNFMPSFKKDKKCGARNSQPVSLLLKRVMKRILFEDISRHTGRSKWCEQSLWLEQKLMPNQPCCFQW